MEILFTNIPVWDNFKTHKDFIAQKIPLYGTCCHTSHLGPYRRENVKSMHIHICMVTLLDCVLQNISGSESAQLTDGATAI